MGEAVSRGQVCRHPGWLISAVLLLLGVAAGMGTCSRFSSDNLVSREVIRVSEAQVEAVFSGASSHRLRRGLPAKISAQGSSQLLKGEVVDVEAGSRGVLVRASFSDSIPESSRGWVLSVEIIP